MATASVWNPITGSAATVAAPASGAAAWIDDNGRFWTKLTSGAIWTPQYNTATRAASAAINTTETVVTQAAVVPVGFLQVGSTIRVRGSGICTSTVANNSTFTLRAGTAGTTADQSIAAIAITAAASGSNIPFLFELVVAIDASGASGTCKGYIGLTNQGTTGINTANYGRIQISGTSLNTTTVTNVEVTYKTAATTTTSTFDAGVELEILPAA